MSSCFTLFETAIGPCGLAWTAADETTGAGEAICAVALPEADADTTSARLARHHAAAVSPPPASIAAVIERIVGHLAGEPDALLDVAVDLTGVSGFRRAIYAHARNVAPGDTITYGEIATALGTPNAAREVGQAMGRNPVPIIVPCHRVLAAGGRLGGFSAPGGAETKLRILTIEGAAPGGQPALF